MHGSKRHRSLTILLACGLAAGCAAPPSGPRGIEAAMAKKLRHAQDALAAVVQADYGAIETHAIALRRISAESMALPQDTVSYSVMAEQFRKTADTLASQAASRNLDGVTASWVELTRTCVACHAQINREREFGDFPGKVSRRAPTVHEARVGAGS